MVERSPTHTTPFHPSSHTLHPPTHCLTLHPLTLHPLIQHPLLYLFISHVTYARTPLHLATRAGHAEVVLVLLQAGANVNAKNSDGDTALHVAASRFTDDVSTINHLLHHGESDNHVLSH